MFKKGNALNEQERQGWFYGHFMPDGDLAKDDRLEIKIVRLNKNFSSKPHFNNTSTKIDIVWQGRAIWLVDGEEIEMESGDYLIIASKTVVSIKQVLSDEIIIQTIRFPSVENDKVNNNLI